MTAVDRPISPPARVLLVKPSALGDVVTAVPVLRGLRRTFPQAHLAWLIAKPYVPLMRHDTDLDDVVVFDRHRLGRAWRSPRVGAELLRFLVGLRKGRYDWVIDLQGLLRSGLFCRATRAAVRAGFADAREGATLFYNLRAGNLPPHTVDRNIALARALGVDARGEDMTLQVSPDGRAYVESVLAPRGLTDRGFLVCVPPTRWPTKRYPVRHWRRVVSALRRDMPVVLLGTSADRGLCSAVGEGLGEGVVDLTGETSVAGMVAVIAAAAGCVCCDSAAKFIAPAVATPVVTLIGPTRVDRTGPYGNGQAVLSPVPCRGCLKRRCGHTTCMELIPPAEVISAVGDMLAVRSG